MIITEIYTEGFRNLSGKLIASPGINILCGDNAQGKTNWLEAIYLLASTKSFRTSTLKETFRLNPINQTSKQAFVRGSVLRERLQKDLQVHLEENTKSFYINGKREAVTRYLGNLDVIVFCAEEMQIVRGEPAERRRFLDRGIVSLTPSYLKTISEYNRVLKQKNTLLKEAQESQNLSKFIDLIASWNQQLIEYSTRIHSSRVDYTNRLSKLINKQLFSQKKIEINYLSSLAQHGVSQKSSTEDYQKILTERLRLRLENEIAVGYSLIGPHRDELEILIDGQEVSKFGSSGEQRSALITLDLAQIAIYHQTFEEYPIFLIDDIDAELDLKRISLLLDHLANKMQVFISTSKREIASQYQKKAQCNFISQGKIIENTSENIFEIVENIFEKQIFENNEIITKTTDLSVNNLVENKENLQIESVKTSASNNVFLVKEDFKEEPSIDEEDRHRAPF